MSILIYTDGSSRGNPGPGGWGTLVVCDGKVWELGGREDETTNNRMELKAFIEALNFIEKRKLGIDESNNENRREIIFHIDSAYVIGGVTAWMYSWEKNGWKTANKDAVLNQDLWKEILPLMFRLKQKHTMKFEKVKGHSGHSGNERADTLATSFADDTRPILFTGSLVNYEKLIGVKL